MRWLLCLVVTAAVTLLGGCAGNTIPDSMSGKIAYVHLSDLYVVNADGTGRIRLTTGNKGGWPSWSPDGKRLVYEGYRSGLSFQIFVIGSDGTGEKRLTSESWNQHPAWSPDGKRIAFSSLRLGGGHREVFTMDPDGSKVQRLTETAGGAGHPVWSPDSKRLAFDLPDETKTQQLYVVDADGKNQARLSQGTESSSRPAWSPDGRRFSFLSDRSGVSDLYVMNSDGTGVRRITKDQEITHARWSPDGRYFVIGKYQLLPGCLYTTDLDGTIKRELAEEAYWPAWWAPR